MRTVHGCVRMVGTVAKTALLASGGSRSERPDTHISCGQIGVLQPDGGTGKAVTAVRIRVAAASIRYASRTHLAAVVYNNWTACAPLPSIARWYAEHSTDRTPRPCASASGGPCPSRGSVQDIIRLLIRVCVHFELLLGCHANAKQQRRVLMMNQDHRRLLQLWTGARIWRSLPGGGCSCLNAPCKPQHAGSHVQQHLLCQH
jgi:hypothetical protein